MDYTDAQVEELLRVYRRLFPRDAGRGWSEVAAYWDFARSRPWSCLTTDFHTVTPAQISAFDSARPAPEMARPFLPRMPPSIRSKSPSSVTGPVRTTYK
jgi:hypothetical protein